MILNKDTYPCISETLDLHFFGDQCVIMDQEGLDYLFDSTQTDIFELCNGAYTINEIIDKIAEIYQCKDSEQYNNLEKIVLNFIYEQFHKSILVFYEEKKSINNIFGERNFYYPTSLSIEITNRCNFYCKHCYKNANSAGNDIDEKIIMEIVKKYKGKVKQIQLTGGEPFLNPNIKKYIDILSDYFEIRIPTNGSLLYQFSDELIKKVNYVQFSLYGCSEEDYKEFAENAGGWNALSKSIKKVNENNVENILSLVLNKENVFEMEKYVAGALQLGAKRIKFGIPTLVGRACDDLATEKSFLLSTDDIKHAYRESRKLKLKYRDKISVGIWSHRSLEPVKPQFDSAKYSRLLPCGAGYLSYVISQDGRIRPCELISEDFFDLGSFEILDDFVKGKFYDQYEDCLNKYSKYLNNAGSSLDYVCTPVSYLYKKIHGGVK